LRGDDGELIARMLRGDDETRFRRPDCVGLRGEDGILIPRMFGRRMFGRAERLRRGMLGET
jgi:hypothetical protein